jgi:hypothetical protein
VAQAPHSVDVTVREEPPGLEPYHFSTELSHAERLLSYAAEVGIQTDEATRDAVLAARAVFHTRMTQEVAANLLDALTKLAALVRPVTARSLEACANPAKAKKVVDTYLWVTLVLGAFSIIFSVITFVTSAICDSIRTDLAKANALALTLGTDARAIKDAEDAAAGGDGHPAGGASQKSTVRSQDDILRDLQQFAIMIRELNEHARELSLLVFWPSQVQEELETELDDFEAARFELLVPVDNLHDEREEAVAKIHLYQMVRGRAFFAQEIISAWTTAVATCVLPIMYAWLGACAYLLRLFEEQRKKRTFVDDRHLARFLIATIGGLVVGLFSKFNLTAVDKLSPLAVAFLVGYAVDVFFSFLEGILQSFGRTRTSPPLAPVPGAKS